MNHYDRLGVEPNATAGEIKRAYRAKARENHPDKGGSSEEFAPIATAYEVLSDPNGRLLYDATGQDQRTPIEQEVQQILLTLFAEALSRSDDIAVIAFVRERVKIGSQRLAEECKKVKKRQKALKAKRGKIKSTATVNLAHMVIDGELKSIEAGLAQMDHQEEIQKAIMAELDAYSEDWKAPTPKLSQTIYFYQPSSIFDPRQ